MPVRKKKLSRVETFLIILGIAAALLAAAYAGTQVFKPSTVLSVPAVETPTTDDGQSHAFMSCSGAEEVEIDPFSLRPINIDAQVSGIDGDVYLIAGICRFRWHNRANALPQDFPPAGVSLTLPNSASVVN